MNGQLTQKAIARRMTAYAVKFYADHHGNPPEPTDEALAASFEHCARVAEPDWYPGIREALAVFVAERNDAANTEERP